MLLSAMLSKVRTAKKKEKKFWKTNKTSGDIEQSRVGVAAAA